MTAANLCICIVHESCGAAVAEFGHTRGLYSALRACVAICAKSGFVWRFNVATQFLLVHVCRLGKQQVDRGTLTADTGALHAPSRQTDEYHFLSWQLAAAHCVEQELHHVLSFGWQRCCQQLGQLHQMRTSQQQTLSSRCQATLPNHATEIWPLGLILNVLLSNNALICWCCKQYFLQKWRRSLNRIPPLHRFAA